jgi:hypothetical protein
MNNQPVRLRPLLALFGHVAISNLSPLCAPKRTSTDHYANDIADIKEKHKRQAVRP